MSKLMNGRKQKPGRPKKKKTDWLVVLMDIMIIVLVFVILWAAFSFYFYWDFAKQSSSFIQNSDMMSYELQNNDYAAIIQGRYINEFNGKKENKSYNALAEYVEAASMYKVYVAKGYAEKASKERNVMDRSRIEMDKLTIFANRVDKMFDVE